MNNKILIVSANYYKEISNNLELGAINTLKENGYKYEVINAPGCFEIPYLIKKNINNFRGFISLGCIIKGETNNFDLISKSITDSLLQLSLKHKKPIGNGIITCFNKKQANSRKDKGREAAIAVQVVLSSFPKKVS